MANQGPRSNDGGSYSSGVKMKDANSVNHFIERFAAFIEDRKERATDKDILTFCLMLSCFQNHYTLKESIEEFKRYQMHPEEIRLVYGGLLTQLKPTVQAEYNTLCTLAARERRLQQRNLEDADSFMEFLDLLAAQVHQNKEKVACQEVFLKCLQSYLSVEETVEELSRYMDDTQASILIHSIMVKMKSSVKEEYMSLCSDAARKKNLQEEEVSPLFPESATSHSSSSTVASGERSAQLSKLEDALTARDFIGVLAGQIQQRKEEAAHLEVLLNCLQRYSSLEEAIEELSHYMDESAASELYHSATSKMKNEVKAEYQNVCQLTGSLPHILQPMADTMKQLFISHNKLELKVENLAIQMSGAVTEQMNKFLVCQNKLNENVKAMADTMNKLLVSRNNLDEQIRKSMQQMKDKFTNTEQNLKAIKDFLYNDFDRRIQRPMKEKFDVIVPSIERKVVAAIQTVVASAETSSTVKQTKVKTELKIAISNVEDSLSSKVEESNAQINKHHQLVRSELEAMKTIIQENNSSESSKLASLLDTAQSLTDDLAESHMKLAAKVNQEKGGKKKQKKNNKKSNQR